MKTTGPYTPLIRQTRITLQGLGLTSLPTDMAGGFEAYSRGVGGYDSEDGVDGGSEGCDGLVVVGVGDVPGLQPPP